MLKFPLPSWVLCPSLLSVGVIKHRPNQLGVLQKPGSQETKQHSELENSAEIPVYITVVSGLMTAEGKFPLQPKHVSETSGGGTD